MPTLTAVMSFSPGTATGVGLLTRVPLPSSAPGVVAPALNRVVDAQGAGAGPAGAQRDGAREAHDRGRDRAAGLRPVPEFAEPIVPPTAGGAVREQRAARLPGSVYARRAGQTMHRDGGESAGVRSIAQLPTPVAAQHLSVVSESSAHAWSVAALIAVAFGRAPADAADTKPTNSMRRDEATARQPRDRRPLDERGCACVGIPRPLSSSGTLAPQRP